MSAPKVDVLAVMAEIESFMGASYPHYDSAEKLFEARAAVAELIKAAHKLRADVFLWRLTGNMPDLHMLAADEEALDAALARIGDAK